MSARRLSHLALLVAGLGLALGTGGRAQDAPPLPPGGNALAGMPLDALSATRERPLFRPSRRPPATAPVAAPMAAPVLAPAESGPRLTLVGIIRSTERGITAVVLDDTTQKTLTIRPGDAPQGWVVQSVDARTAVLARDGRSATLTMSAAPATPAAPDAGIAE